MEREIIYSSLENMEQATFVPSIHKKIYLRTKEEISKCLQHNIPVTVESLKEYGTTIRERYYITISLDEIIKIKCRK